MRSLIPIVLAVACAAGAGIAVSEQPCPLAPPTADTLLGPSAEREALFRRLVSTVRAHRYVSEDGLKRLGTTWDEELEKSKQRFIEAQELSDVYYALRSFANSAHDFHTALLQIPGFLQPRGGVREIAGLRFRPVYESKDGPASFEVVSPGLAQRLLLDGIGGKGETAERSVAELRREYREWFHRGSSPYWLDELFAEWLTFRPLKLGPAPATGQVETFHFRRGEETLKVDFEWTRSTRPFPPPHPVCTRCGELAEYPPARFELVFSGLNYCIFTHDDPAGTTVVRFHSFDYPDPLPPCYQAKQSEVGVKPKLWRPADSQPPGGRPRSPNWRQLDHDALIEQVRRLQKEGAQSIVFDLRRTGGGVFHPALIGHFTREPYGITTKSFHYAPAFSDPDDDWDVLTRRDAVLQMGPFPTLGEPSDIGIRSPLRHLRRCKRLEPERSLSPAIPMFCTGDCSSDEAAYDGVSDPLGPLSLILGPLCSSSCDVFASLLVDNGIADSYGLPTAGASAPYRITIPLRLADDTELRMEVSVGVDYRPPRGDTILEGHPVEPRVTIPPTLSNADNYLTTVLARIAADRSDGG